SRLHLSYLTKYANDLIILLDESYRFLEINERVIDAYGYTRDELIGMHATELRPAETKGLFSEQSKPDPATGRAVYETVHRRKDGTTFPVEISLREIDVDGKKFYQAIIRDITVQKRAEQALRDSERKYRELVENANSIILHWAPDGRILFVNEFGLRFFGYSEKELLGRNVVGTIVPESDSDDRNLKPLMEEIGRDPVAFEQNINENMLRSGERVWTAWTNKVVLDERGRVAEVLSIGLDITARKHAEDELRAIKASHERRVAERTAELVVAKDRAEQADRLKSAFLATMSHELRTPLNSVIGFTGLLLQGLAGPLNDEQAKQLRMVRDSGQHLLALINEVLDISKIEAGQVELHNESFDLSESIRKVLQTVTPQADKKALRLDARTAADLGLITSDRRRVEQILLNLLSNAIKFTKTGEVRVAGRREQGRVVVRVSDTGIGIKPEDLGTLFRPFRQVDSGLTRQYEGTGLGLAISKRLVERMGGAISVESRWGEGSTFEVVLPVEPGEKS
ncbi:MAG: PAS domain S-box protein, partial [Acidobacteriota bacterium]